MDLTGELHLGEAVGPTGFCAGFAAQKPLIRFDVTSGAAFVATFAADRCTSDSRRLAALHESAAHQLPAMPRSNAFRGTSPAVMARRRSGHHGPKENETALRSTII